MIDVVFISDLHLHPDDPDILNRFNRFIEWAGSRVKSLYILGDFFHAWPGDDSIDDWSAQIASQIMSLVKKGIMVSYMPGNRDFLLGKCFARLAGWTILNEPAFMQLGDERVMLVHGDCFCTNDKGHQRFRLFTRNRIFTSLFLLLPLNMRQKMVHKVRTISKSNKKLTAEQMDVVLESVISNLSEHDVKTVIHGHTHKPGLTEYRQSDKKLARYVLSDWDDIPQLLCYDCTKGLYYIYE